jgi:hypothetical protein
MATFRVYVHFGHAFGGHLGIDLDGEELQIVLIIACCGDKKRQCTRRYRGVGEALNSEATATLVVGGLLKKGSNFRNYAVRARVQTDVPLHPPDRSLFLYLCRYDLEVISQKVENHGNASFSQGVDNVVIGCETLQNLGKSYPWEEGYLTIIWNPNQATDLKRQVISLLSFSRLKEKKIHWHGRPRRPPAKLPFSLAAPGAPNRV